MSSVDQELPTISEHLDLSPVFSGVMLFALFIYMFSHDLILCGKQCFVRLYSTYLFLRDSCFIYIIYIYLRIHSISQNQLILVSLVENNLLTMLDHLCSSWNFSRKSLKIPKGYSESIYRRRTDNTMANRKSTKGQTTICKTYT